MLNRLCIHTLGQRPIHTWELEILVDAFLSGLV